MFRMLIVDDEPMALVSTAHSFDWQAFGFDAPATASSGEMALEMLTKERYDAALVDIRMPGLSGLELVRACRERGVGTCFAVLSGYSDFSYVQSALRLNAVDYCLKPVEPEESQRVLGNLLDCVLEKRCGEDAKRLKEAPGDLCALPGAQAALIGPVESRALPALLNALGDAQLFFMEDRLLFALGRDVAPALQKAPEDLRYALCTSLYGAQQPWRVCQLLREHFERMGAQQRQQRVSIGQGAELLGEILEYIGQNLSEQITLGDLAQRFHMNYTYLSELFSEAAGVGFAKYLTNLRMERAKELIVSSALSLTEIALTVGYSNYQHFSASFKRAHGLSPNQLRRGEDEKQ